MSTYQTVVTAVVANAGVIDGVAVDVQCPNYQPEELAYLKMTAPADNPDLESARQRFIDWLHYYKNRLAKRQAHRDGRGDRPPTGSRGPFPASALCV